MQALLKSCLVGDPNASKGATMWSAISHSNKCILDSHIESINQCRVTTPWSIKTGRTTYKLFELRQVFGIWVSPVHGHTVMSFDFSFAWEIQGSRGFLRLSWSLLFSKVLNCYVPGNVALKPFTNVLAQSLLSMWLEYTFMVKDVFMIVWYKDLASWQGKTDDWKRGSNMGVTPQSVIHYSSG